MSFSVRKTRLRFSFTRVKTSPNSGVLWLFFGSPPAADTSGGIGVGPGDIRRYLCIMGGGFLSYRGQLDTHFRHYRCRWLHDGAGILQSVAFSARARPSWWSSPERASSMDGWTTRRSAATGTGTPRRGPSSCGPATTWAGARGTTRGWWRRAERAWSG